VCVQALEKTREVIAIASKEGHFVGVTLTTFGNPVNINLFSNTYTCRLKYYG